MREIPQRAAGLAPVVLQLGYGEQAAGNGVDALLQGRLDTRTGGLVFLKPSLDAILARYVGSTIPAPADTAGTLWTATALPTTHNNGRLCTISCQNAETLVIFKAGAAIARNLADTLEAHRATSAGMAANMIGERKRIIAVVDDDGSARRPLFRRNAC